MVKIAIAFFTSTVGLLLITVIVVLGIFGSLVGTNVDSLNAEEEPKINEVLISKYEDIQGQIQKKDEVDVDLKYIYSVDSVLRNGDFSDNKKVFVKPKNLTCFYHEKDSTNIMYDVKDKQKVYDCMGYTNQDINLFEYSISFYEHFGSEISNDDTKFSGSFIRPTKAGTITNEFGGVDLSEGGGGHTGIDIANQLNTPIYPSAPGKIIEISYDPEGGNKVVIQHHINNKDYVTYYGHMAKLTTNRKVGDTVDVNDQIGVMGQTGTATGVHCHFEIMVDTKTKNHSKAVNPRQYVDFPPLNKPFTDRGDTVDVSADKKDIMKKAGISESDYGHVDYIISHESGWNYKAVNASSGAYGLCQALPGTKMSSAGSDWLINPDTQMKWCNDYAQERYHSWGNAEQWWRSHHWW